MAYRCPNIAAWYLLIIAHDRQDHAGHARALQQKLWVKEAVYQKEPSATYAHRVCNGKNSITSAPGGVNHMLYRPPPCGPAIPHQHTHAHARAACTQLRLQRTRVGPEMGSTYESAGVPEFLQIAIKTAGRRFLVFVHDQLLISFPLLHIHMLGSRE
jgi:hypothetical protein